MMPITSRQFIALLVTCSLGSVGLLAAQPALADFAIFRVQRTYFGGPFPETDAIHKNGATVGSFEPYKQWKSYSATKSNMTTFTGTPMAEEWFAQATVESGNPVGAKFTLPSSFIDTQATSTYFSSTAWTGYTTQSVVDYVNLEGRFRPNNPYGVIGSSPVAVSIHDRYPIQTTVNGATWFTTTKNGDFEFSRQGNLNITPGVNNFGGTMRFLYAEFPTSHFYQYIDIDAPLRFKGYGSFNCTRMGNDCSTKSYETDLGEVASSGMVSRFLLDDALFTNNDGTERFGKTQYRKIKIPNAITKNYYVNLFGPWTTGTVHVTRNSGKTSGYGAHPQQAGYDITKSGADLTITRTDTAIVYKGQGNYTYPKKVYHTTLKGVTRVVSLVKPRLVTTLEYPRIPTDPIGIAYQANRIYGMKVYFLPEPGTMLMLGSGIAGLAGLAFLRRR
jgi:hypothetical protein